MRGDDMCGDPNRLPDAGTLIVASETAMLLLLALALRLALPMLPGYEKINFSDQALLLWHFILCSTAMLGGTAGLHPRENAARLVR